MRLLNPFLKARFIVFLLSIAIPLALFSLENNSKALHLESEESVSNFNRVKLNHRLQNLFEEQAIYLHELIVGGAFNLPPALLVANANRLAQNIDEIANVFAHFYGSENVAPLRNSLKALDAFFALYIAASVKKDEAAMRQADLLLFEGAEQIGNEFVQLIPAISNQEIKFLLGRFVQIETAQIDLYFVPDSELGIDLYNQSRAQLRELARVIAAAIQS